VFQSQRLIQDGLVACSLKKRAAGTFPRNGTGPTYLIWGFAYWEYDRFVSLCLADFGRINFSALLGVGVIRCIDILAVDCSFGQVKANLGDSTESRLWH